MRSRKKRDIAAAVAADSAAVKKSNDYFDATAAELAAEAPACFPDGSAYPAAFHLANLANVSKAVALQAASEAAHGGEIADQGIALVGALLLVGVLVAKPHNEMPSLEVLQRTVDLRTFFFERNFLQEGEVIRAAMLDAYKYREQSGAVAAFLTVQEENREAWIAAGSPDLTPDSPYWPK